MAISAALTEKRRRRITSASFVTTTGIPDDVIISEILPRLPVKTLLRCKCVCRAWRDAVDDPELVRLHLKLSHAKPPTLLVIPRECDDDDSESDETISFHRLLLGPAPREPGTADVELLLEKAWPQGITHAIVPTHCDGLVAVATTTDEIFVCNPATREFVALPHGGRNINDVRDPVAAFGYDECTKLYVVARYFYRKYVVSIDVVSGAHSLDYDIGHEIFTFSDGVGAGSWEPTADPPHAIGPARPICTREAFYWCTIERRPNNALLRFSLRDRAFDVVPCPPRADFIHGVDHLAELGGKLCYVQASTATAFDFWVANDGPRPEWTLRCRVDFGDEAIGSEALFPVAAAGNEVLILADYNKVYSYDERFESLREVVDLEEEMEYERPDGSRYYGELVHHVVPYVESLVSVSGARSQCNR